MDGNGSTTAILVGIYATLALDVFSTFTSSPQTTEINAKTRADTLMKWVRIAAAAALLFGVYGAAQSKRFAPLLAASGVTALMVGLYVHAKNRGLASSEPGTEDSW